ncbi:MAG: indolepyruvate ferredoxin oxidoreductase subunit alpha [Syntrophales bacterium]|nr:indolepyruvate ferredoxin oxidoreductase subunit alpha [Syntrophales bacterium]MCK9527248.1 indolepyruvate ferredoxin oxidoreductase subunit alpha [Syntrophales bacterium]MDX9921282.1 indolepyruvate ferredoxin oxidoreductase subunit alpha [Syntrophales bacterium]
MNEHKTILSGNEAIARGAYEWGVTFAAAYPGTPSTEITQEFSRYDGVYAEWSPNEKVALEVAIGAAFAGADAMAVMKHVGVNVAADPLFTVSYTGTNGGLVLVVADDPSMHSSQNEQDSRNYAAFAKVPMLEPADSEEARQYIKTAFALSRDFDTPVFLRSTTRLSHSKSVVTLEEPRKRVDGRNVVKNSAKYVMVPAMARKRRIVVEDRLKKLQVFAESFDGNRMELNSTEAGIITAGMTYNYAKEAFPEYSFLKLGMVYPLPEKMIRDFASKVKKLYVVEELDPFIEDRIKAMGIDVTGKQIFPFNNEFDPGLLERSMSKTEEEPLFPGLPELPARPPNLCPGCPHRGLFYVLGRLKVFVTGDIGCYTLSFLKPLEGLDSCICMGASIGMAHGMSRVLGEKGRVVGVIGDSTFVHSGIASLLNMAYNRSDAVIVICDNRTTAMTGMQDHPGTGRTLQGEPTKQLDYEVLARALGIDDVKVLNPFDLRNTRKVLQEALASEGPSLVLSRGPCALLATRRAEARKPFRVDIHRCTGCRACLALGCPSISWRRFKDIPDVTIEKKTVKQEGIALIDPVSCNGCGVCLQLCAAKAIVEGVGDE